MFGKNPGKLSRPTQVGILSQCLTEAGLDELNEVEAAGTSSANVVAAFGLDAHSVAAQPR